MRILQDSIEQVLQGLPEQVLSELITHKLATQGVKLSTRERKRLTREILRGGKGKFLLKRWNWWDHRQVSLDFTPQDIEQIERKFTDFLENRLPELIETATGDLSRKVLADLKRKWRAESRLQRRDLAGFRKRLYDRWKLPLEGLRMLLTISRELGSSINQEIRQSTEASTGKHLIDVLVRSHARACQITEEIIYLLEGGFADGAMARWRTLHEVAVVASFVAAHGEDLAERYVLHQAVESKRAAADYEKCQQRLGYEPLKESEVKAVQSSYDAVIARFGPDFGKGGYGWAAHHVKIARPTFVDIERAAGIGHLRAHFRMASHNVHANPKGIFFKLGLLDESQVLLAGPSNAGLADPGHAAALSLAQVSAALGTLQPTLDNNAALQIIAQLVGELGELFGQAHGRLLEDDFLTTGPHPRCVPPSGRCSAGWRRA
jgi:hypothetical protein